MSFIYLFLFLSFTSCTFFTSPEGRKIEIEAAEEILKSSEALIEFEIQKKSKIA